LLFQPLVGVFTDDLAGLFQKLCVRMIQVVPQRKDDSERESTELFQHSDFRVSTHR
jgi:hypothetical protein